MNINKNWFLLQIIFLTIFHVYLFYGSLVLHAGLNLIYIFVASFTFCLYQNFDPDLLLFDSNPILSFFFNSEEEQLTQYFS